MQVNEESVAWTVSYRLITTGFRKDAKLGASNKNELLASLKGHYPVVIDIDYGFRLTFTVYGALDRAAALGGVLLQNALHMAQLEDNYWVVEVRLIDYQDRNTDPNEKFPEIIYYGVTNCAQILGVSKQRISQLVHSGDFPPPDAHVGSRPAWLKSTINRYARRRNK